MRSSFRPQLETLEAILAPTGARPEDPTNLPQPTTPVAEPVVVSPAPAPATPPADPTTVVYLSGDVPGVSPFPGGPLPQTPTERAIDAAIAEARVQPEP